uniref:ATP-binding protein n=1 Tax=viral metagenome TaxID=1070528 RepID=A0A6M3LND6_9ZZZZ
MAERRVLTIESNYCKEWTIKDAIREIIQNGLDTGTEVMFGDSGIFQIVRDKGVGVKLSDFIIGRSSKRNNNMVIGQFGEGLKIGCLVLARENRQIYILSGGKKFVFSMQFDDTWQDKLLTIDVEDVGSDETDIGTTVYLECSEEEIEEARSMFLKLNPQSVIDKDSDGTYEIIPDQPGIIWVGGLAVTKIDALYGYNFFDKALVNRDRAAINISSIKNAIGRALSTTMNREVIATLLRTAKSKADDGKSPSEFEVTFTPRSGTWRKVIKEEFGTKVCLSSRNPAIDLAAMEKNWTVLAFPWSFAYALRYLLPAAGSVIKDNHKIVPLSRLSATDKKFFLEGKSIAEEIAGEAGLKTYPVKIFVDMEKKNEARLFNFNQTGYYLNGVAGVALESVKEHDLPKFVGTLLHEYTHGSCGHDDNSRDFENDLTDVIATLGVALIVEKRKANQKRGLDYGIRKTLFGQGNNLTS